MTLYRTLLRRRVGTSTEDMFDMGAKKLQPSKMKKGRGGDADDAGGGDDGDDDDGNKAVLKALFNGSVRLSCAADSERFCDWRHRRCARCCGCRTSKACSRTTLWRTASSAVATATR